MATLTDILEACDTPPLIEVLRDSWPQAHEDPSLVFRRLMLRVNSPHYPGVEARSCHGTTAFIHCYEDKGTLWARPGISPYEEIPILDLLRLNQEDLANHTDRHTVWVTFNDTHHFIGNIPNDLDFPSLPIEIMPAKRTAFRTL